MDPTPLPTVRVVEQIARIHKLIFNAYCENSPTYPIVSVEVAQPDPEQQVDHVVEHQSPIYELTIDDSALVPGKDACQVDVPEIVKRGITFWNECDNSVQTFLPSLQKKLSESLPGTYVRCLSTEMAPNFTFRDAASPEDPLSLHSAFHITLPGGGGEHIVDLTIEQFGFGRDRWFLPFVEYKAMMKENAESSILDLQDVDRDHQIQFDEEILDIQQVMRKVCDDTDFDTAKQMADDDLVALINAAMDRELEELESRTSAAMAQESEELTSPESAHA